MAASTVPPLSQHGVQHIEESIEGLLHLGRPRCNACEHINREARIDLPGMEYWPGRVIHLVDPDADTLRTRHPATLCERHYNRLPSTFEAEYVVIGHVEPDEERYGGYRTVVEYVEQVD